MDSIETLLGQGKIVNRIADEIRDNDRVFICIEGISGIGKSYIANKIVSDWESNISNIAFRINGDDFYSSRDYFPILVGFSERKEQLFANKTAVKSLTELTKGIPYAGDFVSYIINNTSQKKREKLINRYIYLSPIELDIIFKLQYLVEDKKLLIVADNFHWFDKASIDFLNLIFSRKLIDDFPFLKQLKLVTIITKDQKSLNSDNVGAFISKFVDASYNIEPLNFENYKTLLTFLGLKEELTEEIYKLLYSFTGGHIELIKNLVSFINENSFADVGHITKSISESSYFASEILSMRMKSYGMTGEQITDILEQASIIGLNFTLDELECLTQKGKHVLEPIIKNASELKLIENKKTKLQFSHELLKNIFACKSEDRKAFYHNSFASCLRIIRPGDYVSRANHFFEAGSIDDSITLYIAAYLKCIRNGIKYSPVYLNRIHALGEKKIENYLKIMDIAYSNYNEKQYESAVSTLLSLEENIPKLLIGEKDYLISICLAKLPNQKDRITAKNILESWNDIKNEEGELWVRLMSTLMIIYIHLELFDDARKIEKKLMIYLAERERFDPDAKDGINILRRKSQSLHSAELAIQRTLLSVEYYGPKENSNIPLNPIEYYMSLSNHTGNLLNTGEFEDSYYSSLLALKLIKDYPMLNLPRHEIPINNFIVAGVLSEKLEIQTGLELYEQLFDNQTKYADYILLLNNYSILHLLNNNLSAAENALNEAINFIKSESCIDSYYEYYIGINNVILKYLSHNVEEALVNWENLNNKIPNIPDLAFLIRRHQLIGGVLNNREKINSKEWLNILINEHPHELGRPWSFFGKGYLFSDLQFWSES